MTDFSKNYYPALGQGNFTQSIPDHLTPSDLLSYYNSFAEVDWANGAFVTRQQTSNGQSIVAVSTSPLANNSESRVVMNTQAAVPCMFEFEGSMVRNKHTFASVALYENVSSGADIVPSPINIVSIYQSSADNGVAYNATAGTIVTITLDTALPDKGSSGAVFLSDWVHVTGLVDTRLNYPNLTIKYISPDRKTITAGFSDETALPSLAVATITPTLGTAKLYFYNNAAGAYNAVGYRFTGTTATSAALFSLFGGGDVQISGTLFGDHRTTIGTTAPQYLNGIYGEYELKANNRYRIEVRPDEVTYLDKIIDSVGVNWTARQSRTAVKPAVQSKLTPRFRIHQPYSMSRPIAKIVSISKAGTTTATITTGVAHNLTTGNYVTIKGVYDQTNFASITTPTAVTVLNATQFTIVHGSAVTATSYGGSVIMCNGGQDQGGVIGQNVTNVIAYAGNTSWLQVTGNTSWSGLSIGDYVQLHGVMNATNGTDLGLDGAWEVAYLSTTVMLLKPIVSILATRISPVFSSSLASTNAGGAVILRTTLRSHDVMLKEFNETQVQVDGQGTQRIDKALPTWVLNTLNISPTQTAGSTSATNVMNAGLLAQTSNPTSVTSGQAVRALATVVGAIVEKPYSIPELDWSYTGILTTTTAAAARAAQGAGVKNYVTSITFQNTNATATTLIILDGATAKWTVSLPTSMTTPLHFTFPTPLQSSANAAINVNCGTTGANVYVNMSGYTAP